MVCLCAVPPIRAWPVRRPGVRRTPCLRTGLAGIRSTTQRNTIVGVEGQQQHGQHACALRLRLPVLVELVHRCDRHHGFTTGPPSLLARRCPVHAPDQRLQQLPGVVEISTPEQRRTFAGQPVGGIGRHAVVGHHDAPGWRSGAFRTPARRTRRPGLLPVDHGRGAARWAGNGSWGGNGHRREGIEQGTTPLYQTPPRGAAASRAGSRRQRACSTVQAP